MTDNHDLQAAQLDIHKLDTIEIQGLEVFAHHGVYEQETALGQKFIVSVTFYTDTACAGQTDDLTYSIHYGEAAQVIDEFMHAHTFKLIESAAEQVAAMLLERYENAQAVRVRIEKPWAPVKLPLKTVAVEITRKRS